MLRAIIAREMTLAFWHGGGVWATLAFFIITVTLFPFALGPEKEVLHDVAVGVIWIAMLLSAMMALPQLFQRDYEDGTLEQLLLQPAMHEKLACAKMLSHWIITCLPLIMAAPVLGYMLHLQGEEIGRLVLSLMAGSPAISAIGVLGTAITLGSKRIGTMLAVLILPLYIPVLIFGVGSVDLEGIRAFFLPLGISFLMTPISIFISAAALRIAVAER